MGDTKIEWTDKTWSPLRARVKDDAAAIARAKGYESLVQIATKMAGHVGPHCEHVSDGCLYCYSGTNNHRCLPKNGTGLPFDRRSRDLVDPVVDEKILEWPLYWEKPQKVFVENQSDLFGEWVSDEAIDRVFAVMALCPEHTFQMLTKRPQRMLEYFTSQTVQSRIDAFLWGMIEDRVDPLDRRSDDLRATALDPDDDWPLPNVWLGVSVEDFPSWDARVHLLKRTRAAVRFVSYEPALADLGSVDMEGIDWIIVGGESGPGARPFDIAWARNTVAQCRAAGVACFVKQVGAHVIQDGERRKKADRKGGDWHEWPHDLRVRQFPEVRA